MQPPGRGKGVAAAGLVAEVDSADFAFLFPWIRMGGGSAGRKPACFQPASLCFFFSSIRGGKIHRAENCREAGKQERQEHGVGSLCSGQASGSQQKSQRTGVNSFSLPLPSLMQTDMGGNTLGSP